MDDTEADESMVSAMKTPGSGKKRKKLLKPKLTGPTGKKMMPLNTSRLHANRSLNQSMVKQTLRINNRELARALQLKKREVKSLEDQVVQLQATNQVMRQDLLRLEKVAGLRDGQIQEEVNLRVQAQKHAMHEAMRQAASQLAICVDTLHSLGLQFQNDRQSTSPVMVPNRTIYNNVAPVKSASPQPVTVVDSQKDVPAVSGEMSGGTIGDMTEPAFIIPDLSMVMEQSQLLESIHLPFTDDDDEPGKATRKERSSQLGTNRSSSKSRRLTRRSQMVYKSTGGDSVPQRRSTRSCSNRISGQEVGTMDVPTEPALTGHQSSRSASGDRTTLERSVGTENLIIRSASDQEEVEGLTVQPIESDTVVPEIDIDKPKVKTPSPFKRSGKTRRTPVTDGPMDKPALPLGPNIDVIKINLAHVKELESESRRSSKGCREAPTFVAITPPKRRSSLGKVSRKARSGLASSPAKTTDATSNGNQEDTPSGSGSRKSGGSDDVKEDSEADNGNTLTKNLRSRRGTFVVEAPVVVAPSDDEGILDQDPSVLVESESDCAPVPSPCRPTSSEEHVIPAVTKNKLEIPTKGAAVPLDSTICQEQDMDLTATVDPAQLLQMSQGFLFPPSNTANIGILHSKKKDPTDNREQAPSCDGREMEDSVKAVHDSESDSASDLPESASKVKRSAKSSKAKESVSTEQRGKTSKHKKGEVTKTDGNNKSNRDDQDTVEEDPKNIERSMPDSDIANEPPMQDAEDMPSAPSTDSVAMPPPGKPVQRKPARKTTSKASNKLDKKGKSKQDLKEKNKNMPSARTIDDDDAWDTASVASEEADSEEENTRKKFTATIAKPGKIKFTAGRLNSEDLNTNSKSHSLLPKMKPKSRSKQKQINLALALKASATVVKDKEKKEVFDLSLNESVNLTKSATYNEYCEKKTGKARSKGRLHDPPQLAPEIEADDNKLEKSLARSPHGIMLVLGNGKRTKQRVRAKSVCIAGGSAATAVALSAEESVDGPDSDATVITTPTEKGMTSPPVDEVTAATVVEPSNEEQVVLVPESPCVIRESEGRKNPPRKRRPAKMLDLTLPDTDDESPAVKEPAKDPKKKPRLSLTKAKLAAKPKKDKLAKMASFRQKMRLALSSASSADEADWAQEFSDDEDDDDDFVKPTLIPPRRNSSIGRKLTCKEGKGEVSKAPEKDRCTSEKSDLDKECASTLEKEEPAWRVGKLRCSLKKPDSAGYDTDSSVASVDDQAATQQPLKNTGRKKSATVKKLDSRDSVKGHGEDQEPIRRISRNKGSSIKAINSTDSESAGCRGEEQQKKVTRPKLALGKKPESASGLAAANTASIDKQDKKQKNESTVKHAGSPKVKPSLVSTTLSFDKMRKISLDGSKLAVPKSRLSSSSIRRAIEQGGENTEPRISTSSLQTGVARSSMSIGSVDGEGEGRRSRRAGAQTSYKEIPLNKKMRQGDPGSVSLFPSEGSKQRSKAKDKRSTGAKKRNALATLPVNSTDDV